MILIGSQAAILRGDQPAGLVAPDFDLVGSDTEYAAVLAHLKSEHPDARVIAHDLAEAGRKAIMVMKPDRSRIKVDWLTDQRPSSQLLARLKMAGSTTLFGLECQHVTARTELVSKMAYIHASGVLTDKNKAWIRHYRSKVGSVSWSDELLEFREALRAEYNSRS